MYYAIKINIEKYDGPEPKDPSKASFYQKYTNVYLYNNKNDQKRIADIIDECLKNANSAAKNEFLRMLYIHAIKLVSDQDIKTKDGKYFIDNQEIDKNCPEFDFNFITFLKD